MTLENKKKFLINILYTIVIIALLYIVFKFLLSYLFPFIIGIVLAALVQKPSEFLERKIKIKSGITAAAMVFVFYILLVTILTFVGIRLYAALSGFVAKIPEYIPQIQAFISDLNGKFSSLTDNLPDGMAASFNIGAVFESAINTVVQFLTSTVGSSATGIAKSVPSLIITVIVTIVASCYIAKDYANVKKYVKSILPEKYINGYIEVRSLLIESIIKFFKGYMLLMLITFVELSVGLTILGYPYSIGIAAIIAVVDILPVLGTGTVVIPWAIIRLISGDIWQGIALLILYLVITVVRNFLEPRVIGKQMGLHPLITLASIFVGLRLFGFLGMLAVPVVLIIIIKLFQSGKLSLDKI